VLVHGVVLVLVLVLVLGTSAGALLVVGSWYW
jgi:hypothetical protein